MDTINKQESAPDRTRHGRIGTTGNRISKVENSVSVIFQSSNNPGSLIDRRSQSSTKAQIDNAGELIDNNHVRDGNLAIRQKAIKTRDKTGKSPSWNTSGTDILGDQSEISFN